MGTTQTSERTTLPNQSTLSNKIKTKTYQSIYTKSLMYPVTCYYPKLYDTLVHHNADKTITYQLDQIEKTKRLYYKLKTSPNYDTQVVNSSDDSVLNLCHSSKYLNSLKTGKPQPLAETSGLIWQKNLYPAHVNSVWSSIKSSISALNKNISVTLTSGGHHAVADRGYGFNPINTIALTTKYLLTNKIINNIAILDLDVHLGNGTIELLQHTSNIHIFDIYRYTKPEWITRLPSTLPDNIRVYQTDSTNQYFKQLESYLAQIKKLNPGLVIYHHGVDVYKNDRYGGILKFSEEKIHLRERLLLKSLYRHVPIMIILGGGYVKYDNPSLTTSRKNTLHRLHTIFFEELEKQTNELSSTF